LPSLTTSLYPVLILACILSCCVASYSFHSLLFFSHDPATPEIYTLSLHDALPISPVARSGTTVPPGCQGSGRRTDRRSDKRPPEDRKSTRLNSSHVSISYAVFCLKKKTINTTTKNNTKSSSYGTRAPQEQNTRHDK